MEYSRTLVLMGVSGSGKSSIGALLASKLQGVFEDADDFHSAANKHKMHAKIPLTDEDRMPWLQTLRQRIVHFQQQRQDYVLACSALKQSYRNLLQGEDSAKQLAFIYLRGDAELIAQRLEKRSGHFMPASLLQSQFETLEEPVDAIVVSIDATPEQIVDQILQKL